MFNPHMWFTINTKLLGQYLYKGLPTRHCISQWKTDHVNPRRHSHPTSWENGNGGVRRRDNKVVEAS